MPRPGTEAERALYRRNIQVGVDGSIVQDGSQVYAVIVPIWDRLHTVNYFHGFIQGVPACQMRLRSDENVKAAFLAPELIAVGRNGFVERRLRHLQVKFRELRRERRRRFYTDRMLQVGIALARKATGSNAQQHVVVVCEHDEASRAKSPRMCAVACDHWGKNPMSHS